jgi:hypothetical protein
MGYGDLILFPIFLILFSLFFRAIRNTYDDPLLKKYHRQGFWIKMLGCVAFFVYSGILAPADSIDLYQREGNNIYHLILKDAGNLKWLFQSGKNFDLSLLKENLNGAYYQSEANFMVIRLDTIFSFITLGRYSAISLIFAAISFSGIWKLFLFFYEQYPKMHKKFAIAILYFPTVVFWSGGILKDTICIAALGWITYSLYEILYRKKNIIKNSIILFVFGYLLAIIKVYILISYVPFFILFVILKNIQGIKNKLLKYLLAPTLILACMFGFTKALNSFDDELGVYAAKDLTTSIQHLNSGFKAMNGNETAESNFDLGVEFDGSLRGLIKLAPVAIATTFFRPFLWESHKISQLLASLESLVLMFFTLFIIFKSGLRTLIKLLLTDPLIMYCFFFSVVFALFVGASTLNFGTLVRYKIPCLPFYAISLFLIYEKVKEKSFKKSFQLRNPIAKPEMSLSLVTA